MSVISILSDYFSRDELAKDLSVTTRTLERWHAQRKGPPVTFIGRKAYYRRDAVAKWLLANEQEQPRAGVR